MKKYVVSIVVLIGVLAWLVPALMEDTSLPELPENYVYGWIEVTPTNLSSREEAWTWVCEEYPSTKMIGFNKWCRAVESSNLTESMANAFPYSPDDIFLRRSVTLCVVESR